MSVEASCGHLLTEKEGLGKFATIKGEYHGEEKAVYHSTLCDACFEEMDALGMILKTKKEINKYLQIKPAKNIIQERAIAFAIWIDKHNFVRRLQVYPPRTPSIIKWQRANFPNERTYTDKQLYKKFENEQNI